MTSDTFNDREKAFENKFKHDEELRFKAHNKSIKLLGLWAAGQIGLTGKDADAYADKIIETDVDHKKGGGPLRKVQIDLAAKGIEMTEHQLQNQLNIHIEQAKKALMK